tara:strand:- start:94 stop:330 length:237 start_codon:yes stop_codon:yes gene_type:complete
MEIVLVILVIFILAIIYFFNKIKNFFTGLFKKPTKDIDKAAKDVGKGINETGKATGKGINNTGKDISKAFKKKPKIKF